MKKQIILSLATILTAASLGTAISKPASADNHTGGMTDQTPPMNMGESNAPSIIGIATSNDSFETLTAAIKAADLVETLNGPNSYTVFAPTDEAFNQLPDGALEFLLRPENKGLLQEVLTYHVVPGEVMAGDLSTGGIDALSGGIAVLVTDDARVIVNNASVVNPNIDASNGVIHVINRVLLPSQIRQQLTAMLSEGM